PRLGHQHGSRGLGVLRLAGTGRQRGRQQQCNGDGWSVGPAGTGNAHRSAFWDQLMNRRGLYKYRTGEATIGTMVSRSSRSKPPVADAPAPAPTTRTPGPGRPKDPGKRAAILEAAKAMFTRLGFDGASMDQIAAEAGVSKLTVYSHFGDKESLFAAAVQSHCDTGLPSDLFEPAGEAQPVRERLLS